MNDVSEWAQVQHELRRQIDGLLADRNHLACLLELQRTDKKALESQVRVCVFVCVCVCVCVCLCQKDRYA